MGCGCASFLHWDPFSLINLLGFTPTAQGDIMSLSNINWKIVGWVLAGLAIVLVLIALFVGIEAALGTAGALGGGAGLAFREKKRREAQIRVQPAIRLVEGVEDRLESRGDEIKLDIADATDAEKIAKGHDLLGD